MRFKFEPAGERPGGIRIIGEIPDYRLCHLEGRNGAGKSLAIRLLELISGEQPYQSIPRAWTSLRENLGHTTVTIESLGPHTLRVELKPELWEEDPKPVGEWLGEAFLDGSPFAIASIASLLRVVRIAGDETFEVTVSRRLEAESEAIRRGHSRFLEQFSELEHRLDGISEEIALVEPIRQQEERLRQVESQIDASERPLHGCEEKLSYLESAVVARVRLTSLAGDLPKVEQEISQVEEAIRELDEQLRSAQEKQASLLTELAAGSELEEQITGLRRKREKRLKRLEQLSKKVESLAARNEVPVSEESIVQAIDAAEQERGQVNEELASAGHIGSLRQLARRIAEDLNEHRELDQETVALVESSDQEFPIGVQELREGVQRREVELSETQDDPLLQHLRQKERGLIRRIASLHELGRLLRLRNNASKLLEASDSELTALVNRAEATSESRTEYEKATAEVASIEVSWRRNLAEQAKLYVQADQLRGDKSVDELSEQVHLALTRLSLADETALEETYQAVKLDVEERRTSLRKLREEKVDLQRSLSRSRVETSKIAARLSKRNSLPASVKSVLARSADEELTRALIELGRSVESLRTSLYSTRLFFDQGLHASEELAKEVGRRDRLSSDVHLLSELANEMSDRLRSEFNQEEIRSALFEGGSLQAIDLRKLEARWLTSDGEHRSRPFEAFSSGEQVFAYTRARIERVSSIAAEHKVIALDEFGAFLARDRLERLASYLRQVVAESAADQVIIVVPLAADYRTQAEVTSGALGKRFSRRADAIEEHLYFTEDATNRELV